MSEKYTPKQASEDSERFYKNHEINEKLIARHADDPEELAASVVPRLAEENDKDAKKSYEEHPNEYKLAGIAEAALEGVEIKTGNNVPRQPHVEAVQSQHPPQPEALKQ